MRHSTAKWTERWIGLVSVVVLWSLAGSRRQARRPTPLPLTINRARRRW